MRRKLVKFARVMVSLALVDDVARGLRCYTSRASPVAPGAPVAMQAKGAKGTVGTTSGLVPLVDIGANMLDPMFQGIYREKERHPADFSAVLARALSAVSAS